MNARLLAAILILASPAAHAVVYKCTDAAGKTTFQEQPCPDAAKGGQMALKDGSWLRVDSSKPQDNYGNSQVDTDLDLGGIKSQGEMTIARFKQTYRSDFGTNSTILYVGYLCRLHAITYEPETDPALLAHDATVSYEKFRGNQQWTAYPFAAPAIVAKVCNAA